MGRKRGKDQILRWILEACAGGATKTQIVYYNKGPSAIGELIPNLAVMKVNRVTD